MNPAQVDLVGMQQTGEGEEEAAHGTDHYFEHCPDPLGILHHLDFASARVEIEFLED